MDGQFGNCVKFESDAAHALADLVSVRSDLDSVGALCGRLIEEHAKNASDGLVVDALWAASLIRYFRCFGGGQRRTKLDISILKKLDGEPLEFHQHLQDLRDKLIAHSANAFEQSQVGVALEDGPGKERAVLGPAFLQIRQISLGADGAKSLQIMARTLLESTELQFHQLMERVRSEAMEMNLDDLYRRPPLVIVAPSPADAGKGRPGPRRNR